MMSGLGIWVVCFIRPCLSYSSHQLQIIMIISLKPITRPALSPAQQTGLPRVSFAEPVPNVTVAVGRDAALS